MDFIEEMQECLSICIISEVRIIDHMKIEILLKEEFMLSSEIKYIDELCDDINKIAEEKGLKDFMMLCCISIKEGKMILEIYQENINYEDFRDEIDIFLKDISFPRYI